MMQIRPGFHIPRHLIGICCSVIALAVIYFARNVIFAFLSATGLPTHLYYGILILAPAQLFNLSQIGPLFVVRSRMRRKGYDGFSLERASEYYRYEGINTEYVPHFLDAAVIPGTDVDGNILSVIELARLRRDLQKNEWRKN